MTQVMRHVLVLHVMTDEVVWQTPVPQPFVHTLENVVEVPQARLVEKPCPVPQSVTLPVAAPQDLIVDVPGAMPRQTPTIQKGVADIGLSTCPVH